MAATYPSVPSGCVDTYALAQGVVSFFDDHAYIAPWKNAATMTPKLLQVLEGPRTDSWMADNAPLVAITLLREEEEQNSSDNHQHDLKFYFQIAIATMEESPELADKMALALSDTIRYCLRDDGALLGSPSIGTGNAVAHSSFLGSGWDVEKRPDPRMALWLRNLVVEVIER